MIPAKKEKDYYAGLKNLLEELLKARFSEFHTEITATKMFSNKLKAVIPERRNLIFHFLKEAPPRHHWIYKRATHNGILGSRVQEGDTPS
jgi:hypothetical protein